jgi:hypothetical protein
VVSGATPVDPDEGAALVPLLLVLPVPLAPVSGRIRVLSPSVSRLVSMPRYPGALCALVSTG